MSKRALLLSTAIFLIICGISVTVFGAVRYYKDSIAQRPAVSEYSWDENGDIEEISVPDETASDTLDYASESEMTETDNVDPVEAQSESSSEQTADSIQEPVADSIVEQPVEQISEGATE